MTTSLVTGANKGLGFETARQLIAAGHDVWIGARDKNRGREAAEQLGAPFVELDVTDDASVEEAARTAGPLDVLVNNAGIPGDRAATAGETTAGQMQKVYDTNVFGPDCVPREVIANIVLEAPAEERLAIPGEPLTATPAAARCRPILWLIGQRRSRGEAAMKITRNSQETNRGPGDWFTGDVYVDPVAVPEATSTFSASQVHFTPGARTAWHRHPHGQTIFVTEGSGRCQREGGEIEVIRPGDRVFFEPGENHWHGAAPNRFMAHIAMQQNDEAGSPVTWGEHVTDEQYGGPAAD